MADQNAAIDLTDVAAVSARELSVAVKLLTLHGSSLARAHDMTEDAQRAVFGAYWDLVGRDAARKTATLIRLQYLIEACRSRRMQAALKSGGMTSVMVVAAAAATQRLNTTYGFSPVRLAWAAQAALTEGLVAPEHQAA